MTTTTHQNTRADTHSQHMACELQLEYIYMYALSSSSPALRLHTPKPHQYSINIFFCLLHYQMCYMTVNTQAQTHAQIHIHTQIPAYVQLPALFQPCVPLQPSAHLRHSQVPCPATISVNPPVSAKTLIITHRLCIISVDGNEVAAFYPLALCTMATRSQLL